MIAASQAIDAGLSRQSIRRLVASESWSRVRPSVFALWLPSGGEDLWLQRLSATSLWLGGVAAVSHRAAALVRGLDGVERPPLEFSTNGRRRASESGLIIHRVRLEPNDVELHRGFRITSVARTLVDLCAVIKPDRVERALDHALRGRLVTVEAIREALERSASTHKGRAVLRFLLDAHPERATDSELEVRVWQLLRGSRLPMPERQYRVRAQGRVVTRVDFAYPPERLAIEADGYSFHSRLEDWRRERANQNALVGLGWTVYRITWEDVSSRAPRVVEDIEKLLSRSRSSEA